MGKIKSFIKNNNVKLRSITNLVGCATALAAGLLFVLLIDLSIKFRTDDAVLISLWLFLAIIFAVGGGIFYFFGDSVKHKRKLTLVLKGIGIVLAAGFIPFLMMFKEKVLYVARLNSATIAKGETIVVISLIIIILALVALALNYVLSILFLDEDY